MTQNTTWNAWYAVKDENGKTEWDSVTQDNFDQWALESATDDEIFDVETVALEFFESVIDLAQAEERHIPYSTPDEFLADCRDFVDTWNERAWQILGERLEDEG